MGIFGKMETKNLNLFWFFSDSKYRRETFVRPGNGSLPKILKRAGDESRHLSLVKFYLHIPTKYETEAVAVLDISRGITQIIFPVKSFSFPRYRNITFHR